MARHTVPVVMAVTIVVAIVVDIAVAIVVVISAPLILYVFTGHVSTRNRLESFSCLLCISLSKRDT